MDLEFHDNGSVEISTPEYIGEVFEAFGEDIKGTVSSVATRNLFNIDQTLLLLHKDKADVFHSVVARLLWNMKRSCPDLETAVSFLCTRVSCPTEEDWNKLYRVLQFVKQTKDDTQIITVDNIGEMYTWIDASYAVHNNMQGHAGSTISMGRGILHAKVSKQRLNVKSSTEAEIVGVSEYLPYNIQLTNFMEEQGYKLKKNVLLQDNMSAIKLGKNGRNS